MVMSGRLIPVQGEQDDATLTRRACEGNRDAFVALIERHYERIYRIGARVLDDVAEAEDLAQDVCVDLAAKLPSYRGDSRFTTWLYRVVVNAARDRLRRARARGLYERGYVETEALVRAGREGQDDHARESAWLRQAMDRLPEELRITVLLLLEEDLKHAEAAEILGVSEATVSWRMHEVRKRLRTLAADEEEMVS